MRNSDIKVGDIKAVEIFNAIKVNKTEKSLDAFMAYVAIPVIIGSAFDDMFESEFDKVISTQMDKLVPKELLYGR